MALCDILTLLVILTLIVYAVLYFGCMLEIVHNKIKKNWNLKTSFVMGI